MKISRERMAHHLRSVTVGYFASHNVAPPTLEGYAAYVPMVRESAEAHGDLEYLRQTLDYIAAHPNDDWEDFGGEHYPYSSSDVVAIAAYLRRALFGENEAAAEGVELVSMNREAWEAMKAN